MSPRPAPLAPAPSRVETCLSLGLFVLALAFHAWGMSVGWESKSLPGVEYRQAQTALSAYWIKQENNFSLAYPTPVLGKPWSAPMEFPLYQWSVVLAGKATGWGLTKAGRAVSMACFYLTLPAIFLLLGRWRVAPGRRGLVLALLASCPFYIFYARAFLIETMALMFAVWFWVAFERAVKTRRAGWLALAAVAGTGAGLVKVTTFLLYLLPAGAWALARLWRGRRDGRWRVDLGWMAAALAPAFAATLWWVGQADAIKALNGLADFLNSVHMRTFNFGNNELRLSPALWGMKWRIVRDELTWLPFVAACVPVLWVAGRHRWRAVAFCATVFVAPLAVFPILYAYHDYYYVANTVFLMLAIGLVLVGVSETPRWRWLGPGLAALLVAGQAFYYVEHYYPTQAAILSGGNGLTLSLRRLTAPDEVLAIAGQDWNAMTPYYAQRRALMLRGDSEDDPARIERALAALRDETIGALLIAGKPWQEDSRLVESVRTRGLSARPLFVWRDTAIFLRAEREPAAIREMQEGRLPELDWAPGVEPPPAPLAGRWVETDSLSPVRRARLFASMRPMPVRFFTSFEPAREAIANVLSFSAHPRTRLVFRLPRGAHVLRMQVVFNPAAYNPPPGQDATDGVAIALRALDAADRATTLGERLIDPVRNTADRGPVMLAIPFRLAQDGEVELDIGAGPRGRDTRDWIWIRGLLAFE
ncbi:MAG: glycosyltransferase family 39 protein [Opitutae bacterium]|nr:glycosyltransferase family 39 protein [Opitutae bacterium]